MKPEEGALLDAFSSTFAAIDLLCERQLIQPALVLVYSTIDAAAWLSVPAGQEDVTRPDFVRWVDMYLLPGSTLECTALELYGARCGVLHSFTAFSKLSRERKIRTISYATGTSDVEDLNEMIAALHRSDIVGVHLDRLRKSTEDGLQRFLGDAAKDRAQWAWVVSRAKNLFSYLPQIVMTKALGTVRGGPPSTAVAPHTGSGPDLEREVEP